MNELTITQFQGMIACASQNISARSDEFSRLDAALGDGDHGEAITMAMAAIAKAADKGGDFKTMLGEMGFGVMLETSGSISTLLGAFLLGMSDAVAEGVTELDAVAIRKMFRGGLSGVSMNTDAKVGDKTMMDTLIPAVEAMEACQSSDVVEVFDAAARAAAVGAEATISMRAAYGRAKNLGDKTIGHKDAGAASWACMFESFYASLK